MDQNVRPFTVEEVCNSKTKKDFADVSRGIYKDDPEWISPLDTHVENIFDPRHNPNFEYGTACRWLIRENKGMLVGRIAAFINEKKNKNLPFPVGGIGFFECIDNFEAASTLFNTAAAWLKERRMDAIDGPINFGENNRYWGLLVEGFTATPFSTNYNKPYYRKLFEDYGFKVHYEMFSNEIDLSRKMDARFTEIASWLNKKNDIVIRHARLNNLTEFAAYFREIYNESWQYHEGFSPISEHQTNKFAEEMRHVLIDNFCPFAFIKGEPAGFIIAVPDLNQIFRSFEGRSNIFKMLLFKWRSRNNFLWYRKKGILTKAHAMAIGIKPKFRGQGMETGMMMSSLDAVRAMGFKTVELGWAGDFNPKIIRLHKAVGAYPIRKHVAFRYMLDKDKEVIAPSVIPFGKRS